MLVLPQHVMLRESAHHGYYDHAIFIKKEASSPHSSDSFMFRTQQEWDIAKQCLGQSLSGSKHRSMRILRVAEGRRLNRDSEIAWARPNRDSEIAWARHG
eukprot:756973-Hanusia_phi.AAC.7